MTKLDIPVRKKNCNMKSLLSSYFHCMQDMNIHTTYYAIQNNVLTCYYIIVNKTTKKNNKSEKFTLFWFKIQ
jgi:hypothetical protein